MRGEFQRANQNQNQPQPVQTLPPPPVNQYKDQYFDPTEDPYAFMMGPRRRANSFSGTPMRDWNDIYWRMPNNQHDDIPLGYAAADAYADPSPRHGDALNEPLTRSRARQRARRRYSKHKSVRDAETVDPVGYDSDTSPTRPVAGLITEPTTGQPVYYIPQQQSTPATTLHQGQSPPVYMSRKTSRRYGSQPNLNAAGIPVSQYAYAAQTQPDFDQSYDTRASSSVYSTPSSPYRRRLPAYPVVQGPYQVAPTTIPQRSHSVGDIHLQGQPTVYQPAEVYVPAVSPQQGTNAVYAVETTACPHCNGTGTHTHGQYIYQAANQAPVPVQYVVADDQQ